MGTVIIIWAVIFIAVRMAGKSMDKKMAGDIRRARGEEPEASGRKMSSAGGRTPGADRSAFPGAGRNSGSRGTRTQRASWHNTAEASAAEISFRNLPPGTDELEELMRYNARHERELEARLKSREP